MGAILSPRSGLVAPPSAGLYEIDWSNPITKGLVFASYGGFDYVAQLAGKPISANSSKTVNIRGKNLESNSTTNGGFLFDFTHGFDRLNGQPLLTIFSAADIDTISTWGYLASAPASLTSWVSPFNCAGLLRNSSTLRGRLQAAIGPTTQFVSTTAGDYFVSGEYHTYSLTKELGGTVNFYRDGDFFETGVGASTGNITLLTRRICIFSRNDAATAEGIDGRNPFTFYFARSLTAKEHRSLNDNPWQILKRKSYPLFVPDAGGGVTGSLSETAQDDTASASGTVTQNVSGSLSETLLDDVSVISGLIAYSGSLSVTSGDDTLVSVGSVANNIGSVSSTLSGDALVSLGSVEFSGSVSTTAQDDSISASGLVVSTSVAGSLGEVAENASLSSSGVVLDPVSGSLSYTLEDDTLSSSGVVSESVQGSLSATTGDDTLTASGVLPALLQAECNLVNRNGVALPNLINLSWAWFDSVDPNSYGAPSDQGQTESTDGTGKIVVELPNSALSSGQQGTLVLRSDDGLTLGAYNLTTI